MLVTRDSSLGRPFILVLTASLASQLALFMNGMAAAWTLTGITDSPGAIALLNVASTLPTFLLALLAGALADVASRRRIILVGQFAATAIVAVYAALAWRDAHSLVTILVLSAGLGLVGAMTAPAWMALLPGLVPRERLAGAMNLSSGTSNIAMAVGPALAGAIVALQGVAAVFALNVVVLALSIVIFARYRPEERQKMPVEHLGSAMRMGLRYLRYDRPLKRVILKMVPYAFAAVALMALLPTVARFQLGADSTMFGVLAGAGGIGALLALWLGPAIRSRLRSDGIIFLTMVVQGGVLAVLGATSNIWIALAALVVSGMALLLWISAVMTALQAVLPPWIRGRGVAVYLLGLQGTFTVGAVFWGVVAEQVGAQQALLGAAGLMLISALIVLRVRLDDYVDMDTTPVAFVDLPTATSVHDHDGPILVTAQWVIQPDSRQAFMEAMQQVHRGLKRNGAVHFNLVEDVSEPGHILESFTMATWAEFQAINERTTASDRRVEDALKAATGGTLAPLRAHRVLDVGLD